MSSDLDEDVALRLQPIPESFICPISCATMEDPVAWEAGGWISPGRQEVKTMAGSASVEYNGIHFALQYTGDVPLRNETTSVDRKKSV